MSTALTAKLGNDGKVHVTETKEWTVPIPQSVRDAVLKTVDNGTVINVSQEKTHELHLLVEQELTRHGIRGRRENAELVVQSIMANLSYKRREDGSSRIYYSRYESQDGWDNSFDGFCF